MGELLHCQPPNGGRAPRFPAERASRVESVHVDDLQLTNHSTDLSSTTGAW